MGSKTVRTKTGGEFSGRGNTGCREDDEFGTRTRLDYKNL